MTHYDADGAGAIHTIRIVAVRTTHIANIIRSASGHLETKMVILKLFRYTTLNGLKRREGRLSG